MALDNDDIKQLIAILQKGLTEDNETSTVKKTTRSKKPRAKATKSKPKMKNKFDNMPEFKMHKEDIEFDQKVKKSITARSRDFEPIKVRCRVCGKNEKVAPDLVESIERYKCNKCSTGAG